MKSLVQLCMMQHEKVRRQIRNTIRFAEPIETSSLTIHLKAMNGQAPAALMEVRCY